MDTIVLKFGGSSLADNEKLKIEKNLWLDVLYPEEPLKLQGLNNNSLVLKLNYGNFNMLFTGDIEEIAEKAILQKYKNTDILNCDILKVAHHGSKTSSIKEILEEITPQIALIGVGQKNHFGHPNEEVIKRLQKLKCKIYRTDEMGEIIITVNSKRKVIIKNS